MSRGTPTIEEERYGLIKPGVRNKLRISNLRAAINRNAHSVALKAAVVVLISSAFLLRSLWTPRHHQTDGMVPFIDEETMQISMHYPSEIPPLLNKAGHPSVVSAIYYSCDDCKTKQLAYLKKFDDKMKSFLQNDMRRSATGFPSLEAFVRAQHGDGLMVRLPAKNSPWVPANSDEGRRVTEGFQCAGEQTDSPRPCVQ